MSLRLRRVVVLASSMPQAPPGYAYVVRSDGTYVVRADGTYLLKVYP